MQFYGYIGYDVKLSYEDPYAQVCLIISSNDGLPDYIRTKETDQIFKLCEIHKINGESPSSHITTLLTRFSLFNAPITQQSVSLDCADIAACFVSNNKVHYNVISDVINNIGKTDYNHKTNLSGNYMFPDSYDHALEVFIMD